MEDQSDIANWYADQNILITGATGFMGKILVEKLLRSCPKLNTVYLLVRSKKGKDVSQRLVEFLNCPVFDKIRDLPNHEKIFEKLRCVHGDVLYDNCHLTDQDQEFLREKITTVFHMAANVRFDQQLKSALLQNTGGTKHVLDLASSFKNLKVFVHVSTSYCHCQETVLEEKLYAAPHDPRKMLDLVKWLNPDLIKMITPKLLSGAPNTYAYTKCLTEQLVSEYSHKLPIVIARPSIVIAAWKEPIPGWVDNLNGPTGILVGAGKGVIRTMHCNPELKADLVPVDVTINSLIMIAWKTAITHRRAEVDVYHVTADKDTHVKWGEALEMGKKHFFNNPFSICLWYPGGSIKSSYFVHWLAVFFFHIIPAYFVDFIMLLSMNKPFLVRTQKRIQNGLSVLQYYTTRPWYFHNEKILKIWDGLNKTDKDIFYISKGDLNMEQFMLNYVLGARKYCVHEEPETIPYAKKVLKRLYYIDLITNIAIYTFLFWVFYVYATSFLSRIENPMDLFVNGTLSRYAVRNSVK